MYNKESNNVATIKVMTATSWKDLKQQENEEID